MLNRDYEMMYMADPMSKSYQEWEANHDEGIELEISIKSLNKAIDTLVAEMPRRLLDSYLSEFRDLFDSFDEMREYLIEILVDTDCDAYVETSDSKVVARDIFASYFAKDSDIGFEVLTNLDYAPDYLLEKMKERAGGKK